MFFWAVIAAAVASFSSADTSSGPPKQPTGKWVVHFDDAQCVAERNYGTEEDPVYFVLKQPPLGDTIQLSVMDGRSAGRATELSGTIEFNAQSPQKVRILRFKPEQMKLRVFMMNVPLEKFSPARTATAVRVRTKGFDETFALAQVDSLLDVMNTCVADLRRVWNVDEGDKSEGAVREDAKGDLRGLFSAEDYPWEAIVGLDGGTVKIALLVDETGKVADCSVMETSRVAVLDAQSCAIVKERARFKPAVGENGKPAKDAFVQKITWRVQ